MTSTDYMTKRAAELRLTARQLEKDVRELWKRAWDYQHAEVADIDVRNVAYYEECKRTTEVIAQAQLAVRAVEEVLHRLGRVMQYCDGGKSILEEHDRKVAGESSMADDARRHYTPANTCGVCGYNWDGTPNDKAHWFTAGSLPTCKCGKKRRDVAGQRLVDVEPTVPPVVESTDYRDRVRAEKAELDERLRKLNSFIEGGFAPTVDEFERRRMIQQRNAMANYSVVLGERIAAFPTDGAERPAGAA